MHVGVVDYSDTSALAPQHVLVLCMYVQVLWVMHVQVGGHLSSSTAAQTSLKHP
jgi:hypothetical protein